MAKTQYSLSNDPDEKGFTIKIRGVRAVDSFILFVADLSVSLGFYMMMWILKMKKSWENCWTFLTILILHIYLFTLYVMTRSNILF
jgi:hypothetical protein